MLLREETLTKLTYILILIFILDNSASYKLYFSNHHQNYAFFIQCPMKEKQNKSDRDIFLFKAFKLGMFSPDYVWIVHPRVETVSKWLTAKTTNHHKLNIECTKEDYESFSERILLFDQQNFQDDGKETFSGLVSDGGDCNIFACDQ